MTFTVSRALSRFVGHTGRLHFDAPTLGAALEALAVHHRALGSVLFDRHSRLSPMHRLAVNGTPVDRAQLDRQLSPSDEVEIRTLSSIP